MTNFPTNHAIKLPCAASPRGTRAEETMRFMIDDLRTRGRSCTMPRRFTGSEIDEIVSDLTAIADALNDTQLTLNEAQFGRGFYLLARVRPDDDEAVLNRRLACLLLAKLGDDHLMEGDHVWNIDMRPGPLAGVFLTAAERLKGDPAQAELAKHLRREVNELLGVRYLDV